MAVLFSGSSEPVSRGECTLDQCFLGTSVPTEENEAADVFVEDKYGLHDCICVYFFLKFGADID